MCKDSSTLGSKLKNIVTMMPFKSAFKKGKPRTLSIPTSKSGLIIRDFLLLFYIEINAINEISMIIVK